MLLTAFVDGELTARQRRRVERLLKRVPEARQVLKKLQEDAWALRRLPAAPPPPNLADIVLNKIHERRLTPRRRARLNNPPHLPGWTGLAAAAAVLFVVALGSYLYFASVQPPSSTPIAKGGGQTATPASTKPPAPPSAPHRSTSTEPPSEAPLPPQPKQQDPHSISLPETAVTTRPSSPPPAPELPNERVFTGGMERFLIQQVDGSLLPQVFPLNGLSGPPLRERVLGDLKKDRAFRLELPCRNGTRVVERLQTVLRKQPAQLLMDSKAQERIGQPRIVTSFALFLEDITAEQLLQLLADLYAEDVRTAARHPSEEQLNSLVLRRLIPADHKELAALFGLDPTEPIARPAGLRPMDPTQPLSELTAQQVERALAGQGGRPRPEGSKPRKPAARTILIAPYPPSLSQGGSADMRHHLETRKPARPGTLSILLVFRTS